MTGASGTGKRERRFVCSAREAPVEQTLHAGLWRKDSQRSKRGVFKICTAASVLQQQTSMNATALNPDDKDGQGVRSNIGSLAACTRAGMTRR